MNLPPESRQTMVANAPTFLDMMDDPHWAAPPEPASPPIPVLLTAGDTSPAWLPALAGTTHRRAARHTIRGAGHAPHLTHPTEHVDVIRTFVQGVPHGS